MFEIQQFRYKETISNKKACAAAATTTTQTHISLIFHLNFVYFLNLLIYLHITVSMYLKKPPELEVNPSDIRTVTKMLFSETFVNLKVRTWNVVHTVCC